MQFDELVGVLAQGTREEVLHTLCGLTDQERKKYGPKVRQGFTSELSLSVSANRISLAILATAMGARQAGQAWFRWSDDMPLFIDDCLTVLRQRQPTWLSAYVDLLWEEKFTAYWRLARALVRDNLVATPTNPGYFRGTIHGVSVLPGEMGTVVDRLDHDLGLIGVHLLVMLATEGSGRMLTHHDNYCETEHPYARHHVPAPEKTWRVALCTLAEQGRLDRQKLLDAALAAPLRDWAAADVAWFVKFHDALAPTVDEVAARQATYARLLTMGHGPSVKTAQRELARLVGDSRFDPQAVVQASRATLTRSDLAPVADQLRLLGQIAARYPGGVSPEVVGLALEHPKPQVRAQAAKLLAQLGEQPPPAHTQPAFSVPAPQPLPALETVEPIASAEELAEVLLGLLEEVDALQLERALDGLLRLADQCPSTAEVILARLDSVERWAGDPRLAVVNLAQGWLERDRHRNCDPDAHRVCLGFADYSSNPAASGTLVGAMERRLSGIVTALLRGGGLAVALPSFTDGSLDASALSHRLRAYPNPVDHAGVETALALARVHPSQRATLELPDWLARNTTVARLVTPAPPAWQRIVVQAQSHTWSQPQPMPLFRDTQAPTGEEFDGFRAQADPETTAADQLRYGEYEPRFEQTLALAALMFPHDPDVLAAHAHPYLHRDLGKDRACCAPVMDALARARTPLGLPAASALVLGLAAKQARARTAAQDALLDLARHGLLDGPQLGQQAAAHLADQVVVGSRLSAGLREVAHASDHAVLPVLAALEHLLPALPGRRDATAFVDLAAQLSHRTGRPIPLPVPLQALATGTSALARALRRLG